MGFSEVKFGEPHRPAFGEVLFGQVLFGGMHRLAIGEMQLGEMRFGELQFGEKAQIFGETAIRRNARRRSEGHP